MTIKWTLPTPEELAARGLDADGNPIKAPKVAPKKKEG
jgi:hypothetical protein